MISVIALMCHLSAGQPALCHEVIVGQVEGETGKQVCNMGMAALAEWKGQSPYAGDDWYIGKFRCAPGKPAVRDAI